MDFWLVSFLFFILGFDTGYRSFCQMVRSECMLLGFQISILCFSYFNFYLHFLAIMQGVIYPSSALLFSLEVSCSWHTFQWHVRVSLRANPTIITTILFRVILSITSTRRLASTWWLLISVTATLKSRKSCTVIMPRFRHIIMSTLTNTMLAIRIGWNILRFTASIHHLGNDTFHQGIGINQGSAIAGRHFKLYLFNAYKNQ